MPGCATPAAPPTASPGRRPWRLRQLRQQPLRALRAPGGCPAPRRPASARRRPAAGQHLLRDRALQVGQVVAQRQLGQALPVAVRRQQLDLLPQALPAPGGWPTPTCTSRDVVQRAAASLRRSRRCPARRTGRRRMATRLRQRRRHAGLRSSARPAATLRRAGSQPRAQRLHRRREALRPAAPSARPAGASAGTRWWRAVSQPLSSMQHLRLHARRAPGCPAPRSAATART